MKYKKFKKNNTLSAFSLIEVLISIFLITIGFLSGAALLTRSLRDSIDARNQVRAALLAQEGVEMIRNQRDGNCVSSDATLMANIIYPFNGISSAYDETFFDRFHRKTYFVSWEGSVDPDVKVGESIASGYFTDEMKKVTSLVFSGTGEFPSRANCNTAHKCAYAEVILSEWCGQSVAK